MKRLHTFTRYFPYHSILLLQNNTIFQALFISDTIKFLQCFNLESEILAKNKNENHYTHCCRIDSLKVLSSPLPSMQRGDYQTTRAYFFGPKEAWRQIGMSFASGSEGPHFKPQ